MLILSSYKYDASGGIILQQQQKQLNNTSQLTVEATQFLSCGVRGGAQQKRQQSQQYQPPRRSTTSPNSCTQGIRRLFIPRQGQDEIWRLSPDL